MIRKPIILIFLAAMVVVACQKTFNDESEIQQNKNIEQLQIASSFDWKLTKNVDVLVHGSNDEVVNITSEDGKVVYSKGKIIDGIYRAQISVPTFYNTFFVNGKPVEITSNSIDVNIGGQKASRALATTIYSLRFYGSEYIYIDDASLNGAMPSASSGAPQDFTVSVWIYPKSSTSGRKPIVSKQGTSEAGNQRGFMFSATDGGLEFEVFKSDGGTPSDKTSISSATGLMGLNTWYHVAATYKYVADGTSEMNLYIDGVNVASTGTAVGPVQANSQPFEVGRYYWSGSYSKYFVGYMDDFRVYSEARTQSEIDGDKATVVPAGTPNLELNWLFEEGGGTTAGDETANNNDGNIVGCVYSSTTVPYVITDTDGDGVADGDDDYPSDPDRAFDNYFPAAGYGSLAFEDLWPGKGDYDFNDVVVDYRFHTVTNASNSVVEIFATFPVKASGAYLHNGFGFNLPDASGAFTGNPWKLTVTGYDIQEGYVTLNAYGHEDGQTKPTIIVFDDIFNLLPHPGLGLGVNTEEGAPQVAYDTVVITMEPTGVFSQANFSLTTWNPFIMVDQTRGHEVHLPDYPPTDLVDESYFGMWEDDSDPLTDRYYKTASNLPWAIDIPSEFEWPIEKQEITGAYLHFAEWAESGGTSYDDWYEDDAGYRDDSKIYSP